MLTTCIVPAYVRRIRAGIAQGPWAQNVTPFCHIRAALHCVWPPSYLKEGMTLHCKHPRVNCQPGFMEHISYTFATQCAECKIKNIKEIKETKNYKRRKKYDEKEKGNEHENQVINKSQVFFLI